MHKIEDDTYDVVKVFVCRTSKSLFDKFDIT